MDDGLLLFVAESSWVDLRATLVDVRTVPGKGLDWSE